MPKDLARINRFLHRLRLRSAGLLFLEFLGVWGASFLLSLVATGILGHLGLKGSALQTLFWMTIFILPLAILIRFLIPPHIPYRTLRGAASKVDSLLPEGVGSTYSSVELGGIMGRDNPSGELATAQIHGVSRGVQRISLEQLLPGDRAQFVWLAFSVIILGTLGFSLISPGVLSKGIDSFFKAPPKPAMALAALPEDGSGPALGDITLTLTYPAYLKRDASTLENATGQIQAPLGTQVSISARSGIEGAASAELKVGDGVPVAATLSPSGRLSGAFTITAEGSYRFLLHSPKGTTQTRAYPITIEEDAFPTVELETGEEAPDIPLTAGLDFSYRARDDHGLTEVAFVLSAKGKEERRVMRKMKGAPDTFGGEATWFPQEWGLKQGDDVLVWIEVKDNDTISGPKIGRSKSISVQISSDKERHAQTLKLKEEMKEHLLSSLGDNLVFGSRSVRGKAIGDVDNELRKTRQGMDPILQGFFDLRQTLGEDNLEEIAVVNALLGTERDVVGAWEALDTQTSQALSEASQGRVLGGRFPSNMAQVMDDLRQGLVGALERAVLSMESFANLQRLEEILATGDDLRSAADELREALEKMAEGDGDVSDLLKKIDEVESSLAQMAKQMAKLNQESADWFQNPQSETKELENRLDQIREMLKEGKTEEAQAALEDYMAQMEEMLSGLEEMKEEEFEDVRDDAAQEMAQMLENIEALEEEQKRIATDTEAIADLAEEQAGASQEAVKEAFDEAMERAKRIEEGLRQAENAAQNGDARQSVLRRVDAAQEESQMLESAISAQNLWRALQHAEGVELQAEMLKADGRFSVSRDAAEARKYDQGVTQAQSEAKALKAELEELSAKMRQARNQGAAQSQGLGDQQRSLSRESREAGETLGEYAEESAYVPGEWGEQMEQAAQSMQSAQEKMGRGELRSASQDQGAAEATLRNLRQEMEATRDALQKGQRGQSPQMPGPMAQNQRPGQRPGEEPGQEPGKRQRGDADDWGGRDRSSEDIQIIQQGLSAEEYRDALLEGMRGETPQRYKRQNRDYYEKLVE